MKFDIIYSMLHLSFFLCLLLALPGLSAAAGSFTGRAVRVLDGDTIEVMREGKVVRIRLAEIDCPEKNQLFGKAAKRYTLSLVGGEVVTIRIETTDRYGRIVGEVILPDGQSLNRALVKNGYAWQYKKYSSSADLRRLEDAARSARLGLWADPKRFPPGTGDGGKSRQPRPRLRSSRPDNGIVT